MTTELPVVGACLPVPYIETYRDWLFDSDRDVEVQGFGSPSTLDGDWQPLAAEAKRLLDGHKGRIGIHGPAMGFHINSSDPAIRDVVEKRMLQGIDVCAAIGGTHMVIHSAYSPWEQYNFQNVANWREHFIENTHLTLDKAVRRGENEGVILMLENVMDIEPAERRRVVEDFNSPSLRLSVDTGHAHFAHFTHGAPPVDYFIQDAGALLEHVHLQDADGHADRHWSLGQGSIAWHAVFREIAALGHKPRAMLELKNKDEVPASFKFLVDEGLAR